MFARFNEQAGLTGTMFGNLFGRTNSPVEVNLNNLSYFQEAGKGCLLRIGFIHHEYCETSVVESFHQVAAQINRAGLSRQFAILTKADTGRQCGVNLGAASLIRADKTGTRISFATDDIVVRETPDQIRQNNRSAFLTAAGF